MCLDPARLYWVLCEKWARWEAVCPDSPGKMLFPLLTPREPSAAQIEGVSDTSLLGPMAEAQTHKAAPHPMPVTSGGSRLSHTPRANWYELGFLGHPPVGSIICRDGSQNQGHACSRLLVYHVMTLGRVREGPSTGASLPVELERPLPSMWVCRQPEASWPRASGIFMVALPHSPTHH